MPLVAIPIAAHACGVARMTTLVTFDVDGTLVRSVGAGANALHKSSFAAACAKCFQIDTDIDRIQHHGGTDPLILMKLLVCAHGIAAADAQAMLPRLQREMIAHYECNATPNSRDGLEVLPGVADVLNSLQQRGDSLSCLVTGNLEHIGWHKMAAVDLQRSFSRPLFGGFGSDYCSGNFDEMWRDRAEFIRIARAKADAILLEQKRPPVTRCCHVGDTPNDIRAAADAGAAAVGVCTGMFSRQQLQDVLNSCGCRGVVLDDLSDLCLSLAALGFEHPAASQP